MPCPFCGGAAEVRQSTLYCYPAVVVRCPACGSRTEFAAVGVFKLRDLKTPEKPQWDIEYATIEEAEAEVVRRWNTRDGVNSIEGSGGVNIDFPEELEYVKWIMTGGRMYINTGFVEGPPGESGVYAITDTGEIVDIRVLKGIKPRLLHKELTVCTERTK